MTGDEELRLDVAAAHGLPEVAARILTGSSLAELEASAAELARFVADHRARQDPDEQTDPRPGALRDAATAKAERNAALERAFAPRLTQPRDDHGRFEARPVSFDGGARPRVPSFRSPEREHDELIGRLAVQARVAGSRSTGFFE